MSALTDGRRRLTSPVDLRVPNVKMLGRKFVNNLTNPAVSHFTALFLKWWQTSIDDGTVAFR